jgi:enamine deaminase RidA (YjgF/YER057c/UK114 family)
MLNLVNPDTLPAPASNYSHIVEVPEGTRLVFVSGQVGLDTDGNCAEDFTGQCNQVFANIKAALAAMDMQMSDLVRLNAYLTDAGDVGGFRDIRDKWMAGHAAASTLVMVPALAAPNWKVEIEVVASHSK